jgi:chemotaxis protein MotA
MLAGLLIAAGAVIAGVAATGVNLSYFLQPTGVLIVLGGTLGVTLIAAPRAALKRTLRGLGELRRTGVMDRAALLEELVSINRIRRAKGLWGVEGESRGTLQPFLRDVLMAAVDAANRDEFQAAIETRIRLEERQGEAGAKSLEIAGGFAPTIGVLGTVVGLIDVLRQFSSLTGVAGGIGTAFVSTIYGLALANLLLLPVAHRIRARAAETFEIQEMILEGGLCIYDGVHPTLMRGRLSAFLHSEEVE